MLLGFFGSKESYFTLEYKSGLIELKVISSTSAKHIFLVSADLLNLFLYIDLQIRMTLLLKFYVHK